MNAAQMGLAEASISWPAIASLTAFLATLWFIARYSECRRRSMVVVTAALIAGWMGAQFGAVLLNALPIPALGSAETYSAQHRWSLDGGFLAALTVGFATARWLGIESYRTADLTTPGVALGIVVARWGCFRQGCCYGRTTNVPWGISAGWGSPAQQEQLSRNPLSLLAGPITVHPTQIYELMVALVIATVAGIAIVRASRLPGLVAITAWTTYAIWRLINDALRSPATLTLPWTIVIHAFALIFGLWLLQRRLSRSTTGLGPSAVHEHGNQ